MNKKKCANLPASFDESLGRGLFCSRLFIPIAKGVTFPGINTVRWDAANGPLFTLPERIVRSFEKVSGLLC